MGVGFTVITNWSWLPAHVTLAFTNRGMTLIVALIGDPDPLIAV